MRLCFFFNLAVDFGKLCLPDPPNSA